MTLLQRLRARGEAGLTVIELSVVLIIFGIVSVALFDFLDRTGQLTARTDLHAQAEGDAQLALRIVTQSLRSADPIGSACTATTDSRTPSLPAGNKNCVKVTVSRSDFVGSSCARTEYVYAIVPVGDGTSTLVENRQEFVGTTTCTAQPAQLRRVLLEKVVNTSTQPLFTFYKADGTSVDTVANPTAVPTAATVKMSLYVRYRANSPPLYFSSVAAPRNSRA